jgi:multiple sugar transport system ATP-binding protein
MPPIRIEGLTKTYKDGPRAVDHVDLEIRDGEFMVLVGPSGCGKSTLLQMLAGIVDVTAGTIHIGDEDVTRLDPRKRDIAMVFQSYALYPHLSVRGNLGFGLKLRGTDKAEIARRVDEVARILGLDEVLDRKPGELSGGQRQRVAMGRAIVREPRAFLMDEPLSNLDAKLRVSMRAQLSRLHERLGVTTVYVTHDQVEAMTMGDRVAVLKDGVLQQCDTPRVLYDRPGNAFVAGFIGSPAMNLVEGRVVDGGIQTGPATIPVTRQDVGDSAEVTAGFRPESLELVGADEGFAAVVAVAEELGSDAYVYASFAGRESAAITEGHDIVVRVDPRQTPRPGDTIHLRVRTGELHLFGTATGSRLN